MEEEDREERWLLRCKINAKIRRRGSNPGFQLAICNMGNLKFNQEIYDESHAVLRSQSQDIHGLSCTKTEPVARALCLCLSGKGKERKRNSFPKCLGNAKVAEKCGKSGICRGELGGIHI